MPHPIQRDPHFSLNPDRIHNWHREGVYISQFFNTMSLYFPEGEKFFIQSVRHYRERISDPALQQDIAGFIGQEAMHGREHRRYNTLMVEAGLPAAAIEAASLNRLNLARKYLPPSAHLGATIALEHLTAIMAAQLLSMPTVMQGSDPAYARLWRWHALEETEHKAVAFEVWKTIMPNSPLSYLRRIWGLIITSLNFWVLTFIFSRRMIAATPGRESPLRGYARLFKFLFIYPGLWLRLAPAWLAYFKPGFHPWQHDNRHVLQELAEFNAATSPGE